MSNTNPADIDALRQQGFSYDEIGRRLGTTKDAARGRHVRWLSRGDGDAPRASAVSRQRSAAVSPQGDDDGPSGGGRRSALPAEGPTGLGGPKGSGTKTEIELAWALIAKVTRTEIRLKYSVLADKEIDRVIAERRRQFDLAVQSGVLPSVTLSLVSD